MAKTMFRDREAFAEALDSRLEAGSLAPAAPVMKAIFTALAERDETAEICRDRHGNAEPDPELRNFENVPLGESVDDHLAREVTPYVC